MREFFQGWRRKVGCITLAMALITACALPESNYAYSYLSFTVGNRQHHVLSFREQLSWWSWDRIDDRSIPQGNGWGRIFIPAEIPMLIRGTQLSEKLHPSHWAIPHWPVLLVLTLLSTYLILWKPRRRPPPNTGNPIDA